MNVDKLASTRSSLLEAWWISWDWVSFDSFITFFKNIHKKNLSTALGSTDDVTKNQIKVHVIWQLWLHQLEKTVKDFEQMVWYYDKIDRVARDILKIQIINYLSWTWTWWGDELNIRAHRDELMALHKNLQDFLGKSDDIKILHYVYQLFSYREQIKKYWLVLTPSRTRYVDEIIANYCDSRNVMLLGEAWSGKSQLMRYVIMRIQECIGEIIWGDYDPKKVFVTEGKPDMWTSWVLGTIGISWWDTKVILWSLPFALQEWYIPWIDEIDVMPGTVITGLNWILDNKNPHELYLEKLEHNRIPIKTRNILATWNGLNSRYPNRASLDPSTQRRFHIIPIDEMSIEEHYDILISLLLNGPCWSIIGIDPLLFINETNSNNPEKTFIIWLLKSVKRIQDMNKLFYNRNLTTVEQSMSLKFANLDIGRLVSWFKSYGVSKWNFRDYIIHHLLVYAKNPLFWDDWAKLLAVFGKYIIGAHDKKLVYEVYPQMKTDVFNSLFIYDWESEWKGASYPFTWLITYYNARKYACEIDKD